MKSEFQCNKFSLRYHVLSEFHEPIWPRIKSYILTLLRGCFALYMLIFMIISIKRDFKNGIWFTFETSWNYILVLLYFIYAFFVSIFLPSKENESPSISMSALKKGTPIDVEDNRHIGDKLPMSIKIFWIFLNIAITSCLSVVITYWVLLHNYDEALKADLETYLTIDRHGINLLLLTIDFFLHHLPVQFLHFIYPLIVSFIYLVFNVSYWGITDKLIYPTIDWADKPGKAVGFSVGNLVLIIASHFIWYWINQGKRKMIQYIQQSHYLPL